MVVKKGDKGGDMQVKERRRGGGEVEPQGVLGIIERGKNRRKVIGLRKWVSGRVQNACCASKVYCVRKVKTMNDSNTRNIFALCLKKWLYL